ncbi:hypothetical protein [Hoylesella enoeca]|uniref:hypothetical protein n=1 Tax=Hoylesella enoeca TaxID=76123 RepID=UPI00068563E7|nr:hypothetical protein [Hoylesella enoeca]
MKKKSYLFNNTLAAALFVAVALTVDSCADNDLDNRNGEGNKSAAVSFDVKDVQEAVLADQASNATGSRAGEAASFNNQLCELGLTQADFEPQILEAQTPAGMEACLVETTIPGINPVQHDPQTRATVTKTLAADFSTLATVQPRRQLYRRHPTGSTTPAQRATASCMTNSIGTGTATTSVASTLFFQK